MGILAASDGWHPHIRHLCGDRTIHRHRASKAALDQLLVGHSGRNEFQIRVELPKAVKIESRLRGLVGMRLQQERYVRRIQRVDGKANPLPKIMKYDPAIDMNAVIEIVKENRVGTL